MILRKEIEKKSLMFAKEVFFINNNVGIFMSGSDNSRPMKKKKRKKI